MIKLVKMNGNLEEVLNNSDIEKGMKLDKEREFILVSSIADQGVIYNQLIKLYRKDIKNIYIESPIDMEFKIRDNEIKDNQVVVFINPYKYINRHYFNDLKNLKELEKSNRVFLCMSEEEYPEDIKNSFEISEAV